ncbi:phytoene/squalene synthase family protein [Chloroflexota bacterium]
MREQFFRNKVLKRNSLTFYLSSLLFPDQVRNDVSVLYTFLRYVDDLVDSVPQQRNTFYRFRDDCIRAINSGHTDSILIKSFIDLSNRRDFNSQWLIDFLKSMELDLTKNKYWTLKETLQYIYGSAEVVGLFMANIMSLGQNSYYYAQLLGRAMHYIHMIRDIEDDNLLGRTYLPIEDFGLEDLTYTHVINRREIFIEFMKKQIDRYMEWQIEAEKGFALIPRRLLIPIKTSSDMYKWIARRIELDPFIVYKRKVVPNIARHALRMILNATVYNSGREIVILNEPK